MTGIYRALGKIFIMLSLAVGIIACATFHDLKVRYQLPDASSALEGTRMALRFHDARPSPDILGAGAVPEFKNFTGDSAFRIDDAAGAELGRGQYRVMEMVREAFTMRIEAEGVSGAAPGETEGLQRGVVVKKLLLDLMEGRWIAKMDFQARLEKSGTLLATQKISGEAERHRIVGRREAHRAMSEIFTDVVNRLDLQELIEHAETAHPGLLGR